MDLSKIFWSKCRVKILEKFVLEQYFNKQSGFFIRELCRETWEQVNSVRRELQNLEVQWLLKSQVDNGKKFYFINKKSLIYEYIMWIFTSSYDTIWALKDYFKKHKNVDLLVLSETIKALLPWKSLNIVDIFIIWIIDKDEFSNFLEKTFFWRKVKYAVMTLDEFQDRLEYNDKLVLNILKQKWNIFLKDKLNIEWMLDIK